MPTPLGIFDKRIDESPIAIIDFETTGLTPGVDRVVEVSVVRLEPGMGPKLAFDTLVNPMRPIAATEIHGISDDNVKGAPKFKEIAGELVNALSNCVVAAYNAYFDIKFLSYELSQIGIGLLPPYFCLMYMRPLLGLGSRCTLDEACRTHDIDYEAAHIAAHDAQACGMLLKYYLEIFSERNISTFADLAVLKNYKFFESFENNPFPDPKMLDLSCSCQICSRSVQIAETPIELTRRKLSSYWDTLKAVLSDLEITDEELEHISNEKIRLGLKEEQVRVIHARAFASAIAQFTDDQWLDEKEALKLKRLYNCLEHLGWAPGQ